MRILKKNDSDSINYLRFSSIEGTKTAHAGFTIGKNWSYQRLSHELMLPTERMVKPEEMHTANVMQVCAATNGGCGTIYKSTMHDTDALVTNELNFVLCLIMSDCACVYFVDPIKHCIGIAHSGRRGTEKNICLATINKLNECYGSNSRDLVVAVSPCICRNCYEVDEKTAMHYASHINPEWHSQTITQKNDKYYLDITKTIELQLTDAGVINIQLPLQCTCHDKGFSSYRREKSTNSNLAWIYQKEMESNYQEWKQYDYDYNLTEAWPQNEFPDAKFRYMKNTGCFVTSMAILLRHYNIEKQDNPHIFNPRILVEQLKSIGAYDLAADIEPESIGRLYPIEYIKSAPYSFSLLKECLAGNQPCMVNVRGKAMPYHYVVPYAVSNDDVCIFDPGFDKKRLSEFDNPLFIIQFRKRDYLSAITVKLYAGSVNNQDSLCREFCVDSTCEYALKDIFTKALIKWGSDIANHIDGNYAIVYYDSENNQTYLIHSKNSTQDLTYYICGDKNYVYGTKDYITNSSRYKNDTHKSEIVSVQPDSIYEISPIR